MPKRMIHSCFFSSELVADLTICQRLFMIGMIAIADDQGRLKGNARWLRSQIFPYDDITAAQIEESLIAIEKSNDTIIIYDQGPYRLIQIINWWEYQSLQWAKPSKLPEPAEWNDRVRQMIYQPKRWIYTLNWPGSEDKIEYESLGNVLGDELGKPLPISNTNTNTNTKSIPKKKRSKSKMPATPESLDVPNFNEAWALFAQHRIEIRKKLTPTSAKTQLNKMEKWGVERSIAAIHHSVAQGWTGVFEDKNLSNVKAEQVDDYYEGINY